MEEGSLRCDANISIRPKGQKDLGVKVELKNMNSFRFIKKALQYEADRQINMLKDKEKIVQETRLWDEAKQITNSMRSKEEAHDYRYFPEPDLLPFTLKKNFIDEIKKTLPELPEKRRERFQAEYKLSSYDASILTSEKGIADYFESCIKVCNKPKILSNWITQDIRAELNKRGQNITELSLKPEDLAELISFVDKGGISGKTAKEILSEMLDTKKFAGEIIKRKGLTQIQDKGELNKIIDKVIKANPKSVQDYKNGKENAIMFLVGQVMRESKGKANPQLVSELLKEKLEKT